MSPSQPPLRRFVIVAAPRTGSNWLCTLLDSHPDILCHHEIFNPGGIHLAWSRRDGSLDLGSVAERDRDPESVLKRVWSNGLGHARVGFKMTRGQAEGVLAAVLADRTVLKIVLRRADALATFVSETLARQTGEWESYPGLDVGRQRPRIEVDPDELATHRGTNSAFYEAIDRVLEASGQTAIHTLYERLGTVEEQRRLLAALGVDPSPPLRGVTRKQTPTDLRRVVTNYDAVSGLAPAVEGRSQEQLPPERATAPLATSNPAPRTEV